MKKRRIILFSIGMLIIGIEIFCFCKIINRSLVQNIEEYNKTEEMMETATDEISKNFEEIKLPSLASTIEDSDIMALENSNDDSLLSSSMYVQYGTNSRGAKCIRYVIAVSSLNVDVTFIRTLRISDTNISSKSIKASTGYSSILVNDVLVYPSSFNADLDSDGVLDTDYKYFVCYTMSGFTDDMAELDVSVSVEDLNETTDAYTNQGTSVAYNAANIAGLTYTEDQYAVYDEENDYYLYDGLQYSISTTATCTGCLNKTVTSIEVPDELLIKKNNVMGIVQMKNISKGALSGCCSLESLTLPFVGQTATSTTYTYLGYIFGASLYTNNSTYVPTTLKSVTLFDSCTKLGDRAFFNCSSITEINLSKSITSIGIAAFSGCSNLFDIILPESVTTINSNAFANCISLTDIAIPSSVTKIESYLFYGCNNLISVILPDNITNLGSYSFYNCKSLKNIKIPDSVNSINQYAFYNCSSIENITIPIAITRIENCTFYGCSSLTDISIPNKVVYLGVGAFAYCNGLTDVVVPDSVTTIYDAFYQCNNLISITIPFVGNGGTNSCTYKDDQNSHTHFGHIFSASFPSDNSNCVPSSLKTVIITNTCKNIDSYAFYGCSKIETIIIPDSVAKIGIDVFYDCSSLTYNSYDNGLYMGNSDNLYLYFAKMTDTTISSCNIYNMCKFIGSRAFDNCSYLNSITIPNSVVSIGYMAFNCPEIPSLTIPANVTDIGLMCVNSQLTSLTVDENNKVYDSRNNSNSIIETATNTLIIACQSTIIPDTVTAIGECAFYTCIQSSVVIPGNVITIGGSSFSHSLSESIIIEEGVESIEGLAFYDCGYLKTITIPKSVAKIGNSAFMYCQSMTDITYMGTMDEWNSIIFEDYWNYYIGSLNTLGYYKIHCTDGDITVETM